MSVTDERNGGRRVGGSMVENVAVVSLISSAISEASSLISILDREGSRKWGNNPSRTMCGASSLSVWSLPRIMGEDGALGEPVKWDRDRDKMSCSRESVQDRRTSKSCTQDIVHAHRVKSRI